VGGTGVLDAASLLVFGSGGFGVVGLSVSPSWLVVCLDVDD